MFLFIFTILCFNKVQNKICLEKRTNGQMDAAYEVTHAVSLIVNNNDMPQERSTILKIQHQVR
jgi:hypothetical protein